MGVLPVASPLEFELDLNGKKADWETIVKIPYIGQARLLKAMAGVLNFIFFGFFYIVFLILLILYSTQASSHTGGVTTKC